MQWKFYRKDASQVWEYQPPALHSKVITLPLSAGGWEGVGGGAASPAKLYPGRDNTNCSFFLLLCSRTPNCFTTLHKPNWQNFCPVRETEEIRPLGRSICRYGSIRACCTALTFKELVQARIAADSAICIPGRKGYLGWMCQRLGEHFISQLSKI